IEGADSRDEAGGLACACCRHSRPLRTPLHHPQPPPCRGQLRLLQSPKQRAARVDRDLAPRFCRRVPRRRSATEDAFKPGTAPKPRGQQRGDRASGVRGGRRGQSRHWPRLVDASCRLFTPYIRIVEAALHKGGARWLAKCREVVSLTPKTRENCRNYADLVARLVAS